jgi:GNAT superfamily N-acetyltransferase
MADDMQIERLGSRDWETLRELRLRALADAPTAFESSLEDEQRMSPAEWQRWATESDRTITVIALQGGSAVGIAGGMFDDASSSEVQLVAMWVDPSHRRRGVGSALVEWVVGWARQRGASRVRLWVTETNEEAIALYERAGFLPTGRRKPLSSHPDVWELEMERAT